VVKTRLQDTEQTSAPRNGNDHAAKFAKNLPPLLNGNALDMSQRVKDFEKPRDLMGRQLNGLADGVDYPTQNNAIVSQEASPWRSFLTEMGSLWAGPSPGDSG